MQINSSHLDLLSKFNISEDDLLNDACINISVAGYILASNIKSRGIHGMQLVRIMQVTLIHQMQ